MSEALTRSKKDDKKRREGQGSVAALDVVFSTWLESLFRDESPQVIDVYPLYRGHDKEVSLHHFDIKPNENHGAEWAVRMANDIVSECQIRCDSLARAGTLHKGVKSFLVEVIDDQRGGVARPVGSHMLTMEPRLHNRPAPKENDDTADGEELPGAQKIMLESVKLIHERDRFNQENEGKIVGDTMLIQVQALKDREKLITEMFDKNLAILSKFAETLQSLAERRVEERAVEIDGLNAAENRRDQAGRRDRENMWTDVTRGTITEIVKGLSTLIPGFGQMFLSQMTGQPPPQLPAAAATTTPAVTAGAPAAPQLAAPPEEQTIIDRFCKAAEAHKIDDTHTAAEKLFGKDDDKTGAVLEQGVFTREQVAILSGVRTGKLQVDALDALLMDSGKPEAITVMQMIKAPAFLTPPMLDDIRRFMQLRTEKRAKPN